MLTANKIPVLSDRVGHDDAIFILKVSACIEKHISQPGFGVLQMAKYTGLGRVQLNRKLHYLTGYPPGKLILHMRMRIAKQLLSEGNDTIKQIAFQCGFYNQVSFCRNFFREFRCSPSDYRKRRTSEFNYVKFSWKIPLNEESYAQLLNLARQKEWLKQLLRIAIDNLSNKIFTVDQLAAATCMSSSSLNRRMKELFNVTPQRFLRDLRLQYASELLAAKSVSVAEIAYNTGFFDPAHFCRCFKTTFDCQPSAYNKNDGQRLMHQLVEKMMNQNDK